MKFCTHKSASNLNNTVNALIKKIMIKWIFSYSLMSSSKVNDMKENKSLQIKRNKLEKMMKNNNNIGNE